MELDDAVLDVAFRLERAKDAAISEMGRAVMAQAQIIRMAMVMAPWAPDAVRDVEHLYRQLVLLEGRVMRSRVKQEDRVAVTVARARGFRLAQRLVSLRGTSA